MALGLIPRRRTGDVARPWREIEDFVNRFTREEPLAERTLGWMPSVDISESDGKIMVKAELPGLDPKDIDVEVTGDLLVLRGEKSEDEERKGERYYCRERYAGAFQRSFRLPAVVESDNVDAQFKNGVLTIEIPKSEESKQKKISIKTS